MKPQHMAAALAGIGMLTACTVAAPPEAAPRASAESAARIDWNQAIALLRSGRVVAATQLHDLSVTLTTDDGRQHATKEPAIDAIFGAITLHAPNAQAIVIATE
jgi:hypothetical protein